MYSKINFVYILSCILAVNCNLNKEEGDACEWEGVKGTCVNSHRCLTTLDDKSPKQPVCTQKGQDTIICCTDCELVNDTRNAVLTPTSNLYWKTGQKAWDKCLQNVMELPYECHVSYHAHMKREYDDEKKCHVYSLWGVGGPPPRGGKPRNKYPSMVLIGYGETLETVQWSCGGSIISEKFILTAAHCANNPHTGPPKFVAYGILNLASPTEDMRRVEVKSIIRHPDFKLPKKYNDIALIEVETPIKFNKNVLPACLHVDLEAYDEEAVTATWKDSTPSHSQLNTATIFHMKKYGKEECSSAYTSNKFLDKGLDETTQLCYGETEEDSRTCNGFSGVPLLIKTHVSHCVYTIIGVTSFGKGCTGGPRYDVYTRVSYYVPWIESVVWA